VRRGGEESNDYWTGGTTERYRIMNDASGDHIKLVMTWDKLGETAGLRRNQAGFGSIKTLAEKATSDQPLVINAFLYAFLCPAKNFDLFLNENVDAVADDVGSIRSKLNLLEDFERDGKALSDPDLQRLYIAARNTVARKNARDERRTLATLLFSGPSSVEQVAEDLGISENLASRMLRVLGPVAEQTEQGHFALRTDTDTLAVVLHLLRSTIGLDPIPVLRRRIEAQKTRMSS